MNCFYIITNNNNLVYVRTLKLGKSPFGLNNDSTYENAIHFDDKEEAEKVADELNKTFASFARRKKDLFKVTRVYDRKQDNIDDTFIHNVAKCIREVHKDFIKEYNLDYIF